LSDLVWAAETPHTILDSPVLIQADGAAVASAMGRLLAPFPFTGDDIPDSHTFQLVDGAHLKDPEPEVLFAYHYCKRISGSLTWNGAVVDVMTRVNRTVIGEYLGYAAHAGVVALGDTAVALPADSGGGKTTLCAACVKAGFAYVSDEALCVDPETALVVPYPKPLGMSPWTRRTLGLDDGSLLLPPAENEEALVPPDLLGDVATGPLALRHVVLSEYGHGAASLEPAGGADAMHALLEYSFNHYKFGERAFHLAARLATGAEAWRLTYDDPLEAAALLKERFG